MNFKIATLTFIFVFTLLHISFSQETEERKLKTFTEISLKIDARLHLTQDDEQSFQIKAKPSTLEKVITEVKDNQLVIKYSVKNNYLKSWNPGPVDIYVTIPRIDKLSVSGNGLIEAKDDINSPIVDLSLNGSGDIKLWALNAGKVNTMLSGQGDILLKGDNDIKEFSATISGSGEVIALDMPAQYVKVKISGSGNCKVNATSDLHVRISGSGFVEYTGRPLVDSKIAGAGKIKRIE